MLTARNAGAVFQGSLVLISILLTVVIVQMRILQPGWQPEEELYTKVERFLVEDGASPDEIAIVRNPAGYYLVSERPTIVMPPGGPETILALAQHYGARYFVLEPGGILNEYQQLYEHFDINPGLEYLGEVEGAHIYAVHTTD